MIPSRNLTSGKKYRGGTGNIMIPGQGTGRASRQVTGIERRPLRPLNATEQLVLTLLGAELVLALDLAPLAQITVHQCRRALASLREHGLNGGATSTPGDEHEREGRLMPIPCANPECPDPVGDRKADALYCSDRCKTAVHRERKAAEGEAAHVTAALRQNLRPAQRRVLRALIAAGEAGTTTAALCQPQVGGVRFSARIAELREAGLTIVTLRERQGSNRYWLVTDQQERAA